MSKINETPPGPLSGRAITYERLGGPEVIRIIERVVRPPKAGEVRITVKAAGVIESVGPGVSRLQVGDEVMAALTAFRPDGGAQSTYIVVPAASVVSIPKGSTFAQAATLPMNGLTALRAIELTELKAGQVLAVTGGAGHLAHYVIAAAQKLGLTVIADAKLEESDLVRSYGADFVVERGDGFTEAIRRQFPDGVDALIDTAVLVTKSFQAIRDRGIYIAVRRLGSLPTERDIQMKMVWVPDVLENTKGLEQLRIMVENGEITLKVAGEYSPEQVAEAQQALATGGVRGRPVIVF